MMSDHGAKWKIAEAKQRLSEVIRAAREEPQLIFNRERLVAAVIEPGDLPELMAKRREGGRRSVAARFAELREICAEEDFSFEVPARADRPNPFENASDLPLRHERPE